MKQKHSTLGKLVKVNKVSQDCGTCDTFMALACLFYQRNVPHPCLWYKVLWRSARRVTSIPRACVFMGRGTSIHAFICLFFLLGMKERKRIPHCAWKCHICYNIRGIDLNSCKMSMWTINEWTKMSTYWNLLKSVSYWKQLLRRAPSKKNGCITYSVNTWNEFNSCRQWNRTDLI